MGESSVQQTSPETISRDLKPTENVQNHYYNKIGIYGWRKRCIYGLIWTLLIIIILNLALSLWVLKVMEFSVRGLGPLTVLSSGLKLNGNGFVMDRLVGSNIRSRNGQAIVFKNNRNYTMFVRRQSRYIRNLMILGDNFECIASTFTVKDTRGNTVFSSNKRNISINSECLKIGGDGGIIFKGTVQTPSITVDSGSDLRLGSSTGQLKMTTSKGIYLESFSGHSDVVSGQDLHFNSTEGSINIRAAKIQMPDLPILNDSHSVHEFKFFQLCVCNNGKLYLASPESSCSASRRLMNRICT